MKDFIQKLKEKNLILVFTLGGGLLIVFFIMIVLILVKEATIFPSDQEPVPTPTSSVPNKISPLPSIDLERDYSRLDEITPGKSTLDDVIRINGRPQSVKKEANKTYMNYKTPLPPFTNTVLAENNIVVYSIEKVFGSYRGSVADYEARYGKQDLILFDEDNYPWYVYLKRGIAIENDGKDVGTILYFIPQDKESFMATIAGELNFSLDPYAEN